MIRAELFGGPFDGKVLELFDEGADHLVVPVAPTLPVSAASSGVDPEPTNVVYHHAGIMDDGTRRFVCA